MAERRMFAKSIVLSDAFLDMPLSARCLYFTLGMLADDDGFVGSPKAIMRQCGASQDDMSILLQKRYLLGFNSGVIVIKHWRMNNYLQKDRHKKTTYLEELGTLVIDSKGAYKEKAENEENYIECDSEKSVNESMYTECIQNVYTGKDSIGKDRLGKDSIEIARAREVGQYPHNVHTISTQCPHEADKEPEKIRLGIYNNVVLTKGELEELIQLYPDDYQDMIENLSTYMKSKGKYYEDHFATMMSWKRKDEAKAKENKNPGGYWAEFNKIIKELSDDEEGDSKTDK